MFYNIAIITNYMDSASYHRLLSQLFVKNIDIFYETLGFVPQNYEFSRQVFLGKRCVGEIDVILESKDICALVEVKINMSQHHKFANEQFPFYRSYCNSADIFLLSSKKFGSDNPLDMHILKYWPI